MIKSLGPEPGRAGDKSSTKIVQLNNETDAMKAFILNLIKKGKLESEELLSNTNLKNRQTAFLEAMAACPPG